MRFFDRLFRRKEKFRRFPNLRNHVLVYEIDTDNMDEMNKFRKLIDKGEPFFVPKGMIRAIYLPREAPIRGAASRSERGDKKN